MRYRYPFAAALATAGALALSGCGANFSTAYRTYSLEGTASSERPQSIVIDAKQRAILAAPANADAFANDSAHKRDVFVCAEPSPDALSAITSNFAASLGGVFGPGEEVQGALASAFSEVAGELGKRNATIQLLRDGLYRQCEAYMNGLIDKWYYEEIAHKYVNAMVTLLAVEQLTPSATKAQKVSAAQGATVRAGTNIDVNTPGGTTPGANPSPSGGAGGGTAANPNPNPPAGGAGGGTAANPNPQTGGGAQAEAEATSPAPSVSVNVSEGTESIPSHVSNAVKTMVTWFLTKDTVDFCLRELSAEREGTLRSSAFVEACQKIVLQQVTLQAQIASASSPGTGTFGIDECSGALRSFWKPGGIVSPENRAKIQNAMTEAQTGDVSLALLINAEELTEKRHQVGAILKLPACS